MVSTEAQEEPVRSTREWQLSPEGRAQPAPRGRKSFAVQQWRSDPALHTLNGNCPIP